MRNTVKLVLFSVLVLAVLLVLPNISNAAEATVDLLMCKVYMNATDVDSQKTFTILAIYRYVYDELYN